MPASRLLVAAIVCAQMALGLSGCRDPERCLPGDSAAEPGPAGAEERNEELLEALGYVGWSELETDAAGVTRHIAERSWPGLQLYARQDRHLAELFDMRGRVVHTWRAPQPAGRWHHVEALPDGDLVAIVENHRIDRLDWDSNQRWAVRAKAHHDLDCE